MHTGQYFDENMSEIFINEMNIRHSDYRPEVSSLSHGAMIGRTIEGIETVLVEEPPDWKSIYGDTKSTLTGVLTTAAGLGGLLDYSNKFNGKGGWSRRNRNDAP